MSSFCEELSERILKSGQYSSACDQLFKAYVYKLIGDKYEIEDSNIIKQLSSSVQYYYKSGVEDYSNEGAIVLSMLLNLYGESTHELLAIADNIFYEFGDFPNLEVLKNNFPQIDFRSSFFTETVKELRRELNAVDGVEYTLTDYQRTLWEDLSSDKDIITAAPTSTGKTYIILNYLLQEVNISDGSFAVVVVPTRALIYEIASKIQEIASKKNIVNDIEICTIPKNGPFKSKSFFVMTQERLFELLQTGDLSFDYLFVDEAHNISDKNRGVLLHLTLQKLLENSDPQIIISMPSHLYQNAFDSLFGGVSFLKRSTKHSPVSKIIMSVSLKGRNILISRRNGSDVVSINKDFTGNKFAKVVYRLGKYESNIIYQNRKDYCENVARDIASLIPDTDTDQSLEDAAGYVEHFLHKDFSLARCLRKGVAFHYGPLPGIIRNMIEDFMRRGLIRFVVCTSTLAEGVNLPAKNLFLNNPKIQSFGPSERLDTVTFNNITGRAGRMLKHFTGNIFLFEPAKWDYEDYFDESEKADKIPTYFKLLNDNLTGVIAALHGEYDFTSTDQYSYYTVANKLLKEFAGSSLPTTMDAEELTLSEKDRTRLIRHIETVYSELVVDNFTLEANPTIGYIQQNKLYSFLAKQSRLALWSLPHPRSPEFYSAIQRICTELFNSGIFIPKITSIERACVIAKQWITSKPLHEIIAGYIQSELKFDRRHTTDKCVRDVIAIINDDIRFRMSSALRCYYSLISDVVAANEIDIQNIKLHSYIEVGSCDIRIINLVGFGISRETALEIDRVLPNRIDINSMNDLRNIYKDEMLDNLHPITKQEIVNLIQIN